MTENEKNKNLTDKVSYIFRKYTKYEISKAFGFSNQSGLTGWDNPLNPKIRPIHLLGLQEYFNIPVRIFDDDIIYNELQIDKEIQKYKNEIEKQKKEKMILKSLKKHQLIPKDLNSQEFLTDESIDAIVKKHKEKLLKHREDTLNKLFTKNLRVWKKLEGDWYAYLYSSEVFNKDQYIHQVKTTFYGDYQVIDEFDNEGKLFMGENQSLIIKKTPNEKNFSIIVFNHTHVTYKTFRFTIFSIQNGTGSGGEEMINWGFYTKNRVSLQEVENILGKKDNVQIKLDLNFAKRVRQNLTI